MNEIARKRRATRDETIFGGGLLVILIVFFLLLYPFYTDLRVPGPPSVAYTALLMSRLLAAPILMLMTLTALLLLIFAVVRRLGIGFILVILPVGAFMGMCSGVSFLTAWHFTSLQTLNHQDHRYVLLYTRSGGGDALDTAYFVVECDSLGLACHHYATPLAVNERSDQNTDDEVRALGDKGRLFVDASTQQMYLQGLGKVYPVRGE